MRDFRKILSAMNKIELIWNRSVQVGQIYGIRRWSLPLQTLLEEAVIPTDEVHESTTVDEGKINGDLTQAGGDYSCRVCNPPTYFITAGTCAQHILQQHCKEESVCGICGYELPLRHKEVHMRKTHVYNETSCEFCGKKFRNPELSSAHKSLVHRAEMKSALQSPKKKEEPTPTLILDDLPSVVKEREVWSVSEESILDLDLIPEPSTEESKEVEAPRVLPCPQFHDSESSLSDYDPPALRPRTKQDRELKRLRKNDKSPEAKLGFSRNEWACSCGGNFLSKDDFVEHAIVCSSIVKKTFTSY